MKASISQNTKLWEAAGILLPLGLWWVLAEMTGEQLLPGPWAVLKVLVEILSVPESLWIALVSLGRGFAGIGAAVAIGALVGYASGLEGRLEALLRPGITFMKAVPVVSVILLLFFWFNRLTPAIVGFTIAFPVVYHAVLRGTRETDPGLMEMATVFRVPAWRILTGIRIPSILPYLVAGLDAAIGIGWKSVIAAEVICQPRTGIGTQLMNAKYSLVMEPLFAWTLLAVSVSYAVELCVHALHRRMNRWKT